VQVEGTLTGTWQCFRLSNYWRQERILYRILYPEKKKSPESNTPGRIRTCNPSVPKSVRAIIWLSQCITKPRFYGAFSFTTLQQRIDQLQILRILRISGSLQFHILLLSENTL